MTGFQNINISLKSRAYIDFILYLCAMGNYMKWRRYKGKFTKKWLANSFDYYCPICVNYNYASFKYYNKLGYKIAPEYLSDGVKVDYHNWKISIDEADIKYFKERLQVEGGAKEHIIKGLIRMMVDGSEAYYVINCAESLNNGFIALIKAKEASLAKALVRLQIENLTNLFAELKHPFQVLHKIYFEGKELNEIKVKGKNLMPSTIRKELDEKLGTNIDELYKTYCSFAHPSKIQYLTYCRTNFTAETVEALCSDMILVNQLIADLLKEQIKFYRTAIKEQEY